MTNKLDRSTIKRWATDIVAQVEPGDVFVIEENFDGISSAWSKARPTDEGRFFGEAEIPAFAGIIVPFLLGWFGEILKDIAANHAKRTIAMLLDKFVARETTNEETKKLRCEIYSAINNSSFPSSHKDVLKEGFDRLLPKIGPRE